MGIAFSSGELSLSSLAGVLVESESGDACLSSNSGFAISGTNGRLSLIIPTDDGFALNAELTIANGNWELAYSGVPTQVNDELSEVHGVISGCMNTSGNTLLVNQAGQIAGNSSALLKVYDDISMERAEGILAENAAKGIHSYGAVAMSARMSWSWGDFFVGCGAGAVVGGIGGGAVGSAGGGIGALPGAAIGATIGCVTGGVASGAAGNVIPNDDPDDTHVVQSICIGGVVGGVCGTVGVYVIPKPPTGPSLDPATQWTINQYAAKLGLFD